MWKKQFYFMVMDVKTDIVEDDLKTTDNLLRDRDGECFV